MVHCWTMNNIHEPMKIKLTDAWIVQDNGEHSEPGKN